MRATVSAVLFLLAWGSPLGVWGFLGRGSILEGYGDVLGVFCPDFTLRTPVWHHREVTREGVRRALVRLLQEESTGGFTYRYGMSLEEVHQERYGSGASPSRLVLAVEDIADAAAETDKGINARQPVLHFLNDQFDEAQALLELRWRTLVSALKGRDVGGARHLLGLALGAVQDFYAHSNWIELGHDQILECLGLPAGCTFSAVGVKASSCAVCSQARPDCRRLLLSSVLQEDLLTSEHLPRLPSSPAASGKCMYPLPSGGVRATPVRGGLGKDLPSACFSNRADLHSQAARLAARATSHYLTALRQEVGNDLFRLLLGVGTTPPVTIVYGGTGDPLTLSSNMSDHVVHVLDLLQKKHEASSAPPVEYVLVLYSNTLTGGGVFRSNEPIGLKDHLSSLQDSVPSYIMLNPVKALLVAAHITPPDSEVFIITDAEVEPPGKTSVIHVRELVLQKRIKVTPIVVNSVPSRKSLYTNEKFPDDPYAIPFSLPVEDNVGDDKQLSENADENSTLPLSNTNDFYDDDGEKSAAEDEIERDVKEGVGEDVEEDEGKIESESEESEEGVEEDEGGEVEGEIERESEEEDDEGIEEDVGAVEKEVEEPHRRRRSLSPEIIARLRRLGFQVVPKDVDTSSLVGSSTSSTDDKYPLLDILLLKDDAISEEGLAMELRLENGASGRSITYRALEHIALFSGGHVIDTTRESLRRTLEVITSDIATQVLLYRDLRTTASKSSHFFVDSSIKEITAALYGNFSEVFVQGPDGADHDLLLTEAGPDVPPLFRLKTTFSLGPGQYRIRYSPAHPSSASVFVWGVSSTNAQTAFYRAEGGLYPSLQRLQGSSAGQHDFLNILLTGADASEVRRVNSVEFEEVVDKDCVNQLTLPLTAPRRSSYVRLGSEEDLPLQPFSIVFKAQDLKGNTMVRRSPRIFQRTSVLVEFDDTRAVPWLSGQTVAVSFTVTNIGLAAEEFQLITGDVMGVVDVSTAERVTLEPGKSKSLSMELAFLPRFSFKTNVVNVTRRLHYPTSSSNDHYYYNRRTTTPPPVQKMEMVKTQQKAVTDLVLVTAISSSGLSSTAATHVYVMDFDQAETEKPPQIEGSIY